MALLDHEWQRQPQEQEGDYWFSGHFLVTQGVKGLLSEDDVYWIYLEIQTLVQAFNGIDYLQVFIRESDGQKLYFIDQLTKTQVASGEYADEHNSCTLMLADEY